MVRHVSPAIGLILLSALLAGTGQAGLAAPRAVAVRDLGRKTLCAEEDNVYATLSGEGIRRFEVIARHPAYGVKLKRDNWKADFTDCRISGAKDFPFTPRNETLYEDDKVVIRGVTYSGYWRPERVEVAVGDRRDAGLHLIQLMLKRGGRLQEVMVIHAADGYWRLRPLPLPQFQGAVYGSSFLLGPVEEDGRPLVKIRRVEIDPKRLVFRALFAAGGEARVQVGKIDARKARLAVELDPPVQGGRPFAALRSMYVSPRKADTAEVHWRGPGGQGGVRPAVGFGEVQASEVRFGRQVPSRHNTSAPDMVFEGFDDGR